MVFETFKIIYLVVSVLGAALGFWLVRKDKNALVALLGMTLFLAAILVAFYFDARRGQADIGEFMEYVVRGLTHINPDIILTICNILLWGTLPFALGIMIKDKQGMRWLWLFFLGAAVLKTLFDDNFIIHQFPEELIHPFEWGYVFFDWAVIYSIAGFFIRRGTNPHVSE